MQTPLQNTKSAPVDYQSGVSSRYLSVRKVLTQTKSRLSSPRGTSAIFASKHRFSESSLLQAPLIGTPDMVSSNLSKSGTSFVVKLEDWLTLNLENTPSNGKEHPTISSREVDDLDLMLCHEDFPQLVDLSARVGEKGNSIPAVARISEALNRLKLQPACGKNLIIERGNYPSTDHQMECHFIDLGQELDDIKTCKADLPSSSVGDWNNIPVDKRDVLLKATVDVNEHDTVRISDMVRLSEDIGVPVADIVSFMKSRGREEVKLSVLQQVAKEQTVKECMDSFSIGTIDRSPSASSSRYRQHHPSARRSPRLSAMTGYTPIPLSTQRRPKSTASRGRPPKHSVNRSHLKVRVQEPGQTPPHPRIWYPKETSNQQYEGSPSPMRASASSSFIKALLKRSAKRPALTPVPKNRSCVRVGSVATDGVIDLTPRTTKKPRRNVPMSSLKVSLERNTPMSDISFRSPASGRMDVSFLGGLDTFSESPFASSSLSVASQSIHTPGANTLRLRSIKEETAADDDCHRKHEYHRQSNGQSNNKAVSVQQKTDSACDPNEVSLTKKLFLEEGSMGSKSYPKTINIAMV